MSIDASIPKALYQANIDLALRIAALLQENGKQWFDLFAEEASTRLEEGLSQASSFGSGLSLEKLSSLPADAATQLLQIDLGRWQTLLSSAVENQSHFAEGVQHALSQWQDACSGAFDAATVGQVPELPSGLAVLPGLSDMAASIRRFMAQAVPAVDTLFTPAKPTPAPRTAANEPVAKKPKEKKVAARKPAPTKAVKPQATKPVAKKSAKSASRKPVAKAPATLAPALAPKPLPAVVTLSRRTKKPAP